MDCLRSFNVRLQFAQNFESSNPNVKFWGTGNNINFIIENEEEGHFEIQGFKNINLYGVKMVGDIIPYITINRSSIIDDWSIRLVIVGQPPLISGNITSSSYTLNYADSESTVFQLTKYTNNINFASPIASASLLTFSVIKVSGIHCETDIDVGINADLNFTFFYKYEGE